MLLQRYHSAEFLLKLRISIHQTLNSGFCLLLPFHGRIKTKLHLFLLDFLGSFLCSLQRHSIGHICSQLLKLRIKCV